MDAKEAALVARSYFIETKGTSYFLFETNKVETKDGIWEIECEIKDIVGGEKWRHYTILIDDVEGAIKDILRHD